MKVVFSVVVMRLLGLLPLGPCDAKAALPAESLEECLQRTPSFSQDAEQQSIMEMFYPERLRHKGFFVEIGGFDGKT